MCGKEGRKLVKMRDKSGCVHGVIGQVAGFTRVKEGSDPLYAKRS